MKQTHVHPAMIVRAGLRYGLRVLKQHAKATHDQHRPDLEYIPNDDMQLYRVGPLPFGTTRLSLSKVFQSWNWIARPGQPVGQDKEHTGMFWSAMASQPPSHWVYHCEHGDILTSRLPGKRGQKPSNAFCSANIEASKLTLQHLAGPPSKDSESRPDPWLQNDPRMQPNRSAKQLSPHQVAAMEASIEKKVLDTIRPQMYRMDDDEDMPSVASEQKVHELEAQVTNLHASLNQIQQNVQQLQQQQAAQNQQMTQQIQTVQHQVDSQQQGIQSLLDKKMSEQMERIEALFNKRAKTSVHE